MTLDSKWIPVLLIGGWLFATLGLWGACGLRWWLWPLSLGLALLLAGSVYLRAAILLTRAAPKKPEAS